MKTRILVLVGVLAAGLLACEDEGDKLNVSLAKKDSDVILKVAKSSWDPSKPCPTPGELVLPREFVARGLHDPWGKDFKIDCAGNQVKVVSSGPDKKEGTADDIVTK